MPAEEQDQVLAQIELKRLTPNTAGSLQELKAELFRVRKNGYASDLEEHELHIRCVAAPIWDHTGAVQSSVSITAPSIRMPVARLRQLAPRIQTAGLQIPADAGHQPAALSSRSSAESRNRQTALKL